MSRCRPQATALTTAGSPRKGTDHGPYGPLVMRFHEALVLSYALGTARAARTKAPRDGSLESTRKLLLNDLAYVCDSDKGGDTTTALAIESRPSVFVFWFALNKVSPKAALFLGSVLDKMKAALHPRLAGDRNGDAWHALVESLTQECLLYAQARIAKEVDLLRKNVARCLQHLQGESPRAATRLVAWLQVFQNTTAPDKACFLAYKQIKDRPEMAELRARGEVKHFIPTVMQPSGNEGGCTWDNPFYAVQHSLGRLANHIGAPQRLLDKAECLQEVLESDFVVRQADGPGAMPGPKLDKRKKVDIILGRLVASQEKARYAMALAHLDTKFHVQERVNSIIQKVAKPTVHAEIKILDLFHKDKKSFFDNFRFIGCSKPSCYCCRLYIQHHPARCIEPDSHENLWPNWSPPVPPEGSDMRPGHYLHATLQKVVEKVREDALEQIESLHDPLPRQFDSTTGITRLDAVQRSFGQMALDQDARTHHAYEEDLLADSSEVENSSPAQSPGSNRSGSSAPEVPSTPGSNTRCSISPTGRLLAGTDPDVASSESDDEDGGGLLLFRGRA